jgi:hypothetical protein
VDVAPKGPAIRNLLHQWTHRSPRRQTIVRRFDLA